MRTKTLSLVLAFVPATLVAQASGSAAGSANGSVTSQSKQVATSADANASTRVSFDPPREFSAEGRARLTAMYNDARKNELPPEPIARRVAEGQAKGASEVAILASAGKVSGNLQTTHDVLVRAGRTPTADETAQGANAIERGFTEVQLETVIQRTPSDRSLTVAFDVLSQLAARGVPVTNALAQVQAKLDARAPDTAIRGLVNGSLGVGRQ